MSETALKLLQIGIYISMSFGMIFSFVTMLNIIITTLIIGLNGNVLSDIYKLVQTWLPFNLNVVILWLTVATLAYIGFKLSQVAFNFVKNILSV